jgi:hypothetical protein
MGTTAQVTVDGADAQGLLDLAQHRLTELEEQLRQPTRSRPLHHGESTAVGDPGCHQHPHRTRDPPDLLRGRRVLCSAASKSSAQNSQLGLRAMILKVAMNVPRFWATAVLANAVRASSHRATSSGVA